MIINLFWVGVAFAMKKVEGIEAEAPASSATDKYLADIGYEPARADQFELPPLLADPDASAQDISVTHGLVTGWMTAAKLSKEAGKNLAALAATATPRWEAMSEGERQVHHATTESQLQRLWGDAFDGRVARAQQLVNEIDKAKPGFKQFVEESGVGNEYGFVLLLSDHAELLAGRHARREAS